MDISSAPTTPISACNDQQSQDFARMLRRHRSSLKSFLRKRLFNEEEVEDAVQETSLRLFRYQAQHAIESPTALLYRIAERVAVDFQRRAQSHRASKHFPLDDTRLLSADPLPEQLASAEQSLSQLIDALEQLPPKCQDVFVLSRVEGLSYPEIASRCGISVKMVEKYISRALAQLRARVGEQHGAAP